MTRTPRKGSQKTKNVVIRLTLALALIAAPAAARDLDGRYAKLDPKMHEWFEQLCIRATDRRVLNKVFQELRIQRVALEGMILKPNMAISGKKCAKQALVEVAAGLRKSHQRADLAVDDARDRDQLDTASGPVLSAF
jgi:hypothetical protein